MGESPHIDVGDLRPLPAAFFERDAATVARELLGMLLVSTVGGETTGGVIVETEAYLGSDDPGSHAATRGITPRNRVMYGPANRAYVYFTYGNHHMLNLVTCPEGEAGAVLIRAIEPVWGTEMMIRRRGRGATGEIANGPGKLAQALGITLEQNAAELGREIAVYEGPRPAASDVGTSGRIGLGAGHELPLRFFLLGSEHLSRGRPGMRAAKKRR